MMHLVPHIFVFRLIVADMCVGSQIPVSGVNIGPISKRDVIQASTMLEHQREYDLSFCCCCCYHALLTRICRYACILAFDVKPNTEAAKIADKMGIKIFTANIIYHLERDFMAYIDAIREEERNKVCTCCLFVSFLCFVLACGFFGGHVS